MVCFHYTCGVFLSWSLHAGFLNCNRRVFRYCIKVRIKYFKVNSIFLRKYIIYFSLVYRSLASIIFITYIVVAIIHKLSFNFLKNCLIWTNFKFIKIMTQRQSGPYVTRSGKTYLNAFANGSKKSFANRLIAVRTTKHTVRTTA